MSTDEPTASVEEMVVDLTREMPNYMDRITREVGGPISELWSVVLASSGRMAYIPEMSGTGARSSKIGVVDAALSGGRTRYGLWKAALLLVLEILGDPEARYRTGYDVSTLASAVERFFNADRELSED